jgi:hypothetical protein
MDPLQLLLILAIAVVSFGLAFFGSAVGLVMGQLRLPLLIYWLGNPMTAAVTNLAVSGLGALSGSYQHLREGRISWSVLAIMGIPSAAGAVVGLLAVGSVDPKWAKAIIGVVLLFLGWNLIATTGKAAGRPQTPPRGRIVGEIFIGVGLGMISGVVGLMLGSLRLPVLLRVFKIDPRVAVGTNMAIGCLTAVIGTLGAWAAKSPDLLALAIVGPPTIVGGLLGARMTGRMKTETLQPLLGWTIVVAGVVMAIEGGWGLLRLM